MVDENRGAGDGGREGKYHDTGVGEVAVDDSDAGDDNVAGEGNEMDDGADTGSSASQREEDRTLNRMLRRQIRVF